MKTTPEVTIASDGSCLGNPGAGGFASVCRGADGMITVVKGGEFYTTNNRMEQLANIYGLESQPVPSIVTIICDSQYVVRGYTEWLPGWIRNGWRTAKGGPVSNQDLWERLDRAVQRHVSVTWTWVRGHNGHPLNELADQIASQQAQEHWRPGGARRHR